MRVMAAIPILSIQHEGESSLEPLVLGLYPLACATICSDQTVLHKAVSLLDLFIRLCPDPSSHTDSRESGFGEFWQEESDCEQWVVASFLCLIQCLWIYTDA